jgi:CheY-like chemotaxis protein
MLKLHRANKRNRRQTVLIVDDDPAVRDEIQHRLENCPWNVLTAADGREALEIATAHKPDLVLLDIRMPQIDGHTVLAQLRQHPHTAETKVIMLTASQDVSDITKAASCNIQDYITKPFYPVDAVARIEQALSN